MRQIPRQHQEPTEEEYTPPASLICCIFVAALMIVALVVGSVMISEYNSYGIHGHEARLIASTITTYHQKNVKLCSPGDNPAAAAQ